MSVNSIHFFGTLFFKLLQLFLNLICTLQDMFYLWTYCSHLLKNSEIIFHTFPFLALNKLQTWKKYKQLIFQLINWVSVQIWVFSYFNWQHRIPDYIIYICKHILYYGILIIHKPNVHSNKTSWIDRKKQSKCLRKSIMVEVLV